MKKFWNKYYWFNTTLLWIIGIIFGALITNSCTETVIQYGSTKTKNFANHAKFESIKEFTYKNHDYIMFETSGLDSRTAGVVHNPECKYCKSYEQNKSKIQTCNNLVE